MTAIRSKLTYANVGVTLLGFAALGGGAAFAASSFVENGTPGTTATALTGEVRQAPTHAHSVTNSLLIVPGFGKLAVRCSDAGLSGAVVDHTIVFTKSSAAANFHAVLNQSIHEPFQKTRTLIRNDYLVGSDKLTFGSADTVTKAPAAQQATLQLFRDLGGGSFQTMTLEIAGIANYQSNTCQTTATSLGSSSG